MVISRATSRRFGCRTLPPAAPIHLHRASVYWNDYRHDWIMIGNQENGTSPLGEVWFSEAPTPEGPWANAIKVATHHSGSDNYTFYNPTQDPFFDEDGGRIIYFEGTYSNTFSGNSQPTPLYDYNQMMYRLDLSTIPSLLPPTLAGDYNGDGKVDAADYTVWRDTFGSTTDLRANGDNSGASQGVIDQADYLTWVQNFGAIQAAGSARHGAGAGVDRATGCGSDGDCGRRSIEFPRVGCCTPRNSLTDRFSDFSGQSLRTDCLAPSRSRASSACCTSPES